MISGQSVILCGRPSSFFSLVAGTDANVTGNLRQNDGIANLELLCPTYDRLNWRRDLNCPSFSSERSYITSLETSNLGDATFEQELRVVTLVPAIKMPFDILAEELISKNSRGDRI
jgi:hypothetical protein